MNELLTIELTEMSIDVLKTIGFLILLCGIVLYPIHKYNKKHGINNDHE